MVFERLHTEGIAQLSYLIGDNGQGTAAVIDPRPDCDVYLELARQHGVAITHIFETHIHADFMSGSLELSRRFGSVPRRRLRTRLQRPRQHAGMETGRLPD